MFFVVAAQTFIPTKSVGVLGTANLIPVSIAHMDVIVVSPKVVWRCRESDGF